MKQLHPGAKWAFRINTYTLFIFLFVIFGWMLLIPFYSGLEGSAIFYVVYTIILLAFPTLLIIVFAEVYARLSYKFFKYEFTGEQLRIERGIIWKKYSNVPYQRVQNVDITRGIVARICGFSSVNIQTAGYSMPANGRGFSSEGYIPAVSVDEAEKIREFVMKKISKRTGSGL